LLLALDQEPERTHSIERLLSALELLGLETTPLRQLPLKALQRMTSASRYPDGEEAPVDLFDERDGTLALAVARAVVGFADQQLGERDAAQPP
jgi:HEPN domain-containing protein